MRTEARLRGAFWALAACALAGGTVTPAAAAAPGGREIVVAPGTAVPTVGQALRMARDGDRIRIRPGVYAEGVLTVDRSVSLVGEGWPVLDGEGKHAILHVTADGVEVRGLVLRNAGVSHVRDNAALRFDHVSGCVAEGNRLEGNFFGIYLARARECRLSGNVIRAAGTRESTSGNGIHMWNASHVTVERNDVRGHRDGIYLEFTTHGVLRGNRSEGNLRYGLHFMFSNDNAYERNIFRGNGAGVAVMYAQRVRMEGNVFENNWGASAYGLLLKEITDSEIVGNRFRGNTVGIYSEGTSRVRVHGNEIRRNGWGVKVMSNSRDNRFTENNFVDNSFDVSTNSRRNPNAFDGNYWSRYTGDDLTGNGVGDVPHRPVRLFSLVVERHPAAMVLLRSLFVDLLDVAERVIPALTPETLVDENPRMREVRL
jgi:nitrous oxidase accessory protein